MAAQSETSGKRKVPPAPAEGPKPFKAYKNSDFLNSHNARLIRVMCELQEPGQRLDSRGIDNIVMFFGSARAKPKDQYEIIEDRLNPFVTPDLGFEFHYFFTRKFWMCYKCMGLVVAPGGLGTCDELFELMTLMQTGKIKRKLPIILIGKKFWQACIKWEAFVEYGMISESDASQLIFVDTADEAFEALTSRILALEAEEQNGPCSPKSKSRALKTG